MTPTSDQTTAPVRRSVTVNAGVDRAFRVFTDGFDTWWPRSHHIGKSPAKKAIIEPFAGGRCYTEQEDGTDCQWGSVITWEPPRRLVLAWQITAEWGFEPELSKSSEVEVRFTPEGERATRVDLEHRHFDRMGPGGASMRKSVDSAGGWGDLLRLYTEQTAKGTEGAA